MSTTILDTVQAAELAGLLETLEDWLIHTDEYVLAELTRFAYGDTLHPQMATSFLIEDLGAYACRLRRDAAADEATREEGEQP